ncbi:MAG: DUF2911 domain-containing protein [Bacteroidota bacterium]
MRILALFSLLLLIAAPTYAQDMPTRSSEETRVSPNAMIMQTVGTTNVTVLYGRPSVKGRTLFGPEGEALEAYGKVWRSGANEATVIRTSAPLMVEGEELPAGTYALFTIPNEDSWTVIFNRTADQWGAYNYDASQDQLRVEVTPMEVAHTEQLTYSFENVAGDSATLALKWGTVGVPVSMGPTERRRQPE